MCGITLIINKSKSPVDSNKLKRLNDLILHRGPDSEGFYEYLNLGFGHRRLSILDLSSLGQQPMSYMNNFVITYNGEVYNYLELRNELIELGYNFNTNTDTEVVLAAYAHWGIDFLKKLNGMYAFALLNKITNEVILARDRFGIKPLYYSDNEKIFSAGSEIKQLINEDSNEVDICKLVNYVITATQKQSEHTFFKHVKSLMPGHYLIFNINTNSYKINRYYDLELFSRKTSNKNGSETQEFLKLLYSSIKRMLRSDVKVGTCLSGGLDSSAISCIASELHSKSAKTQFVAVHGASREKETDELEYANSVAKSSNLDIHITDLSVEEFNSLIDEVTYTQEEPFPSTSVYMSYIVFRKAKEVGCKVMLDGQGADELLYGYTRYFGSYLRSIKSQDLIKQCRMLVENNSMSYLSLLVNYLYFNSTFSRKLFKTPLTYLRPSTINKYSSQVNKSKVRLNSNVNALCIDEICNTSLPALLRYEDKNSMRHSIEARLPFLDNELVEFCISLPLSHKILNGWTKFILRDALQDILPKSVVWRTNKYAFEAPTSIFDKNNIESMKEAVKHSKILEKITKHKELCRDFHKLRSKKQWLYYNIAVWERLFKVHYADIPE